MSEHTSVVLVGGSLPAGALTLEANQMSVPLPAVDEIGGGLVGGAVARFWRFRTGLAPSTSYVLRVQDAGGS